MSLKVKCNIIYCIILNQCCVPCIKKCKLNYLQSTLTLMRFETLGGTPFDAMHKYAPMSSLEMRDMVNFSPSHSVTINTKSKTSKTILFQKHTTRWLPALIPRKHSSTSTYRSCSCRLWFWSCRRASTSLTVLGCHLLGTWVSHSILLALQHRSMWVHLQCWAALHEINRSN